MRTFKLYYNVLLTLNIVNFGLPEG